MVRKTKSSHPHERKSRRNNHLDASTSSSSVSATKMELIDEMSVEELKSSPSLEIKKWTIVLAILITSVFLAFVCLILSDMFYTRSTTPSFSTPTRIARHSSVLVFIASIPMTHYIGTQSYDQWPPIGTLVLFQHPRFSAFQMFGWIFYVLGSILLVTLEVSGNSNLKNGCLTLSSVLCFAAQVLMVSSLMTFETNIDHHHASSSSIECNKLKLKNASKKRKQVPAPTTTPTMKIHRVVILNHYMNSLLVIGALMLAVASEVHLEHGPYYLFSASTGSISLFVVAIFNTYGLGGALVNNPRPAASAAVHPHHHHHNPSWKFWQPFAGGAKFLLFQLISWSLSVFGVLLQTLVLLATLLYEFDLVVGIMTMAGIVFCLAEIAMLMSLMMFQSDVADFSILQWLKGELMACLDTCIITCLMNFHLLVFSSAYVPYALTPGLSKLDVLVFGTSSALTITLFVVGAAISKNWYAKDLRKFGSDVVHFDQPKYQAPVYLSVVFPLVVALSQFREPVFMPTFIFTCFWYTYVYWTASHSPEITGSRTKNHWIEGTPWFAATCERYFQLKIIKHGSDATLDPNELYIMGYHPHGIQPATLVWFQFSSQWRTLFPNVYAAPLAATAINYVVIFRDFFQMYGGREVSQVGFTTALDQRQSVVLIPGGQMEMIESRSNCQQTRLYVGHHGFLRLALEYGCAVVPLLSFREGEIMSNVQCPAIQKFCVKAFGVPFPFAPYGRWFLPIPRRTPLTLVVGEALEVPKVSNPTKAQIEALHTRYYAQIRQMFEQHKEAAGCKEYELVLVHK